MHGLVRPAGKSRCRATGTWLSSHVVDTWKLTSIHTNTTTTLSAHTHTHTHTCAQDDDDEGEGEEEHTVWWRRGRVWLRIVAFSLSGLMLLFGLLTHTVPAMSKASDSGVELFR